MTSKQMKHTIIKASNLGYTWIQPRTKNDWIAAIEEIIERNPTCAKFISDELLLPPKRVEAYLREMSGNGIIEKSGKIMISGQWNHKYKIASRKPIQPKLIDEMPTRDWLVAAFFGGYKPCY